MKIVWGMGEVAKCRECHTANVADGEPDKTKWLKGATLDFKPAGDIPGGHATTFDITSASCHEDAVAMAACLKSSLKRIMNLKITRYESARPKLRARAFRLCCTAIALTAALPSVRAQTDEIQVYDAAIAEQGKVNLMIHMNFTPIGWKTPRFPGAIIANDSFQTTAEWAYGVTPWFEQGLYMPVSSPHSTNYGGTFDGFKIRELFVRPHADEHTFFYGLNFEFSVNHHYWEDRTYTSELRPIVGLHLKPWDIIFNPIVDTDYTGGPGNLQFNPSLRVAYNINGRWAVAAEQYAGFGPLHHFVPVNQQFQESWAVVDRTSKTINIEAGVGVGVTGGADRLTFKLMLSRDLN